MTRIASIAAAAAIACSTTLSPAAAAGPRGMAIVAGAEVGFGMCLAGTEKEGYACATAKCEAAGKDDPATQCEPVKWCPTSGFGGVVKINNSEGFTYAEYLCDEPDRASLTVKARGICTAAFGEAANGCAFVAAWDPAGKELPIEDDMSSPDK
jgi:hypothetical protein